MAYLDTQLQQTLTDFYSKNSLLTVLTGAGLSADSGIPTFRDKNGFWTVGSVNYTPEEMGTYQMFTQQPLDVWKWFLYRHTICAIASPNTGHHAIREMEDIFADRFRLITQNVDGLHFKANSSRERTYLIHGTLEKARCGAECSPALYPFPEIEFHKGDELTPEQVQLLICPACGGYLRPHVLWFDEYYNEHQFRSESAMQAAADTGLLLIVGTSGATTLPHKIVDQVLNRPGIVIDINPNENAFSRIVNKNANGYSLRGPSSEVLPEIVALFIKNENQKNPTHKNQP